MKMILHPMALIVPSFCFLLLTSANQAAVGAPSDRELQLQKQATKAKTELDVALAVQATLARDLEIKRQTAAAKQAPEADKPTAEDLALAKGFIVKGTVKQAIGRFGGFSELHVGATFELDLSDLPKEKIEFTLPPSIPEGKPGNGGYIHLSAPIEIVKMKKSGGHVSIDLSSKETYGQFLIQIVAKLPTDKGTSAYLTIYRVGENGLIGERSMAEARGELKVKVPVHDDLPPKASEPSAQPDATEKSPIHGSEVVPKGTPEGVKSGKPKSGVREVEPSAFASKAAANRPYVQSGLDGIFYARCIPQDKEGSAGSTDIYRVNKDRDELVDHYDWYSAQGVVLGWSPTAGKVAAVVRQKDAPTSPDKQVELTFHLGGKLLKSLTTDDMVRLGAEVLMDRTDRAKRAEFQVLGSEQIANTNDYVFTIQLAKGKKVRFDILTGEEFHK